MAELIMPCVRIDSHLVLQIIRSAHCTITMATKKDACRGGIERAAAGGKEEGKGVPPRGKGAVSDRFQACDCTQLW